MKKRDPQDAEKGRSSEAAALRATRQAEALRANLRRRKEQMRARRTAQPRGDVDEPGESQE